MYKGAPGRWRSGVALVILVWALFDLSVPGLCTTEEELLPGGATVQQEYVLASTVQTPRIQSAAAVPIDQNPLENDCWCCCSHVVPPPHFEMSVISSFTYDEALVFERPSLGWPPLLYHPPRG